MNLRRRLSSAIWRGQGRLIRRLRESGFVSLLYPKNLGGGGGTLHDAAQSVLEIAKVDGSTAALLGFNYYNSLVPLLTD